MTKYDKFIIWLTGYMDALGHSLPSHIRRRINNRMSKIQADKDYSNIHDKWVDGLKGLQQLGINKGLGGHIEGITAQKPVGIPWRPYGHPNDTGSAGTYGNTTISDIGI